MSDTLAIAGREFRSRLFLGTADYPNQQVMLDSLAASGTEMVTAAIRRINLAGEDETLVDVLGGRCGRGLLDWPVDDQPLVDGQPLSELRRIPSLPPLRP